MSRQTEALKKSRSALNAAKRGNCDHAWADEVIDLIDKALAEQSHTYASTQATNCTSCGEHKHTPLRIDKMGGYVCLTCIDSRLESLLDQPQQPPLRKPITEERLTEMFGHGVNAIVIRGIARMVEEEHNIKDQS